MQEEIEFVRLVGNERRVGSRLASVSQNWQGKQQCFLMISPHDDDAVLGAGLGEMEFRLQDYEVLFYVFPDTESALVAIVPALANKGLLEVEMENARREILKVMNEQDKLKGITVHA